MAGPPLKLTKCLDGFFEDELLESYTCDKPGCKFYGQKQENAVARKTFFAKLPEILVFHLKRELNAAQHNIDVPDSISAKELKLANQQATGYDCCFDLYAVVHRSGLDAS